jgi:hypothetical protein
MRTKSRRAACALALAAAMSGCASSLVWFHPTRTQEEFARDQYECQRDASMLPYAPPPAPVYQPPPASYSYTAYSTYSPYTGVVTNGAVTPTPHPAEGLGQLANTLQGMSHDLFDRARRDSMMRQCMEARGYSLVNRSETASRSPNSTRAIIGGVLCEDAAWNGSDWECRDAQPPHQQRPSEAAQVFRPSLDEQEAKAEPARAALSTSLTRQPAASAPPAPLASPSPATPSSPHQSRPVSGAILSRPGMDRGLGEIKVSNQLDDDTVVTFLGSANRPYVNVYVRASESAVIREIAEGEYRLTYVVGDDWMGDEFGRPRGTFRLNSPLKFEDSYVVVRGFGGSNTRRIPGEPWNVVLRPTVGEPVKGGERAKQ